MNDAGKVAFTPKGDYSSTVTYEYLDTVVYNGNAYAALKTTTGNAPTDSDTDENWKLLARGGESVPMASDTTPGVVKASSDIGVSDDGSMVLKTDFTQGSYENLIPYPYYHTTVTRNGITFTDNGDGTITANGTATNMADFYCQNYNAETFNVPAGIYTMSGCPEGGSTSTFYQILGKINDDGNAERVLTNTEVQNVEFTKNTDVYVIIRILKNTTVSNLTFKPMLEVGSIAHAYKPYSLSNAGLQKQIDNDVVHNFNISSSSAITETGKYVLDATEKNASVEGTLANRIGTINTNLSNKQDKLTNPLTQSDVINSLTSTATTKPLSAKQGNILYEAISEKQNALIYDTYVNTETSDANGSITLGIDISGYKLSQKPKCAFLQGQHTSFSNYIYSYDNSTNTLAVFVVNYGASYANASITNRYGVMIVK